MSYVHQVKVYLNELEKLNKVLSNLKLANLYGNVNEVFAEDKDDDTPDVNTEDDTLSHAQCLTCKQLLSEREEQIMHYKSDWHRYNLKLKLLGRSVISGEEFLNISDVLSISGSETDGDTSDFSDVEGRRRKVSLSLLRDDVEEDEQHDGQFDNRMPKLYFENNNGEVISIYKRLLYSKQMPDVHTDISQLALAALEGAHNHIWTIILFSAGHFAAAVFVGEKLTVHKTFHKYIVRAKRGTAQSLNDSQNKHSQAKSAGASLRRHNEQALEDNIKALLKAWKEDYLNKSALIFLRIPQYRKTMLYGGKDPLLKSKDSRIRSIPFVTRRPTLNEVKRVHQELFSVTVQQGAVSVQAAAVSRPGSGRKTTGNDERKIENGEQRTGSMEKSTRSEEQMDDKVLNCAEKKSGREEAICNNNTDYDDDVILTSRMETFATSDLCEFEAVTVTSGTKGRKKQGHKSRADDVGRPTTVDAVGGPLPASLPTPSKPCSSLRPEIPVIDKEEEEEEEGRSQLTPPERALVNSLYTCCKTSNIELLRRLLARDDVTGVDVMEDARMARVVCGAVDARGNTLLHVAARAGHREAIRLLLQHGSDPAVKNYESYLPYCVCPNKEARNVFRKFRALFPDRYDYAKAQVPSPLSEEREQEMKRRQNEKKKEKRAARKEKEKEKRDAAKRELDEQLERERFLALSDREKRLIAIERRMMKDPTRNPTTSLDSRRCWTCGDSLFAKVPFQYLDFVFCTIKCLKTHKNKATS